MLEKYLQSKSVAVYVLMYLENQAKKLNLEI